MFSVEPGHRLYGLRNVEPCRMAAEPGYKLCSAHGGQTILKALPRRAHEIQWECPECGAAVAWDWPEVTVEELRDRRVRRMRAAGATEEQVQSALADKNFVSVPAPHMGPLRDYADEVALCVGCRYCGWQESAEERQARLDAYAVYIAPRSEEAS